jgi:hypothetical protein
MTPFTFVRLCWSFLQQTVSVVDQSAPGLAGDNASKGKKRINLFGTKIDIYLAMQVSEIQLFQILKEKIGEKEAQSLIEFVETKVEKEFDSKKDSLATKEDLANVRSDVIKWMFIFWVGQLAAMIAIAKLFHV